MPSDPSFSTLSGLHEFKLRRAKGMVPGTLGQVLCTTYKLYLLGGHNASLELGDPLVFLRAICDGACFWVLSRHGTHWIDADFFQEVP